MVQLCDESTEFALQESTPAWALKEQAEQFLVPLPALDFKGSKHPPPRAPLIRPYLSSRTYSTSGRNGSEEPEKLKIVFFTSLGHVYRAWHLVLCLGNSSSHQTRGNAPAGQHVDLQSLPIEREQNNSLFLSSRVMIRQQALPRPVLCQPVDIYILAPCAEEMQEPLQSASILHAMDGSSLGAWF